MPEIGLAATDPVGALFYDGANATPARFITGCPGDGTPGAKAASDYIACPAAEGAFTDFCEHFLF